MPDLVTLTVNRQRFGGWTSVEVTRSLEAIAGAFTLGVTDREGTRLAEPPPIARGDACTVAIDGDVVLTGFVDDVSPSFSAEATEITVRGRDRTGDLVDCAAVHPQWRASRRLEQLATDLCRPFGIPVRTAVATGEPFPTFALNTGETVFEALERLCRQRALLTVSDGRGGLVLTRAAQTPPVATLAEGETLLTGRLDLSDRERFSEYRVLSQPPPDLFAADAAPESPAAVATDPGVRRYRPLVVLAEETGGLATLQERARWEASVRAGRARRATLTVQGWRTPSGVLWAPNTRVHVRSRRLRLDEVLLIAGVTLRLSEAGSTSELVCVPREAFDRIPLPERDDDEDLFG